MQMTCVAHFKSDDLLGSACKAQVCRPKNQDKKTLSSSTWLAGIMGDKFGKPYNLLKQMAVWHLEGRQILHGNPVAIPILGTNCYFRAGIPVGLAQKSSFTFFQGRLYHSSGSESHFFCITVQRRSECHMERYNAYTYFCSLLCRLASTGSRH